MKHLVLYFGKSKVTPEHKTFDTSVEKDNFIQAKARAGIECFEYDFVAKYSSQTTINRETTLKAVE